MMMKLRPVFKVEGGGTGGRRRILLRLSGVFIKLFKTLSCSLLSVIAAERTVLLSRSVLDVNTELLSERER